MFVLMSDIKYESYKDEVFIKIRDERHYIDREVN